MTVSAASLGSREADRDALSSLCRQVAVALDLAAADVYAALVSPAVAVLGDDSVQPWPVIILHGRARDPAAMSAALSAVRDTAARVWRCQAGEVWAQWVVAGS